MKIALMITCLGMGGAENQLINLADRLSSLGHKVIIISLTGNPLVRPNSKDVRLYNLNMSSWPHSVLKAYFTARKIIQSFDPDVVHSHMVHANIFARLLRICTPMAKLVCTSHSSFEGGIFRTIAYRVTDVLADLNTGVSEDVVRCAVQRGQVNAAKIIAVYNGIDCERFAVDSEKRSSIRSNLGIKPGQKMLLAVGRFTAAKDYPNLFRAFKLLSEVRQDVLLYIVGAGADEEKESYESAVRYLGIENKVRFLGSSRDVPGLMNAADVFVLSSAWEGFGLVVAEAMACERVVVATSCGGVGEVIGECGFLAPVRDSEALGNSLVQAFNLAPEAASALVQSARARVLKLYSLQEVALTWLKIYEKTSLKISSR